MKNAVFFDVTSVLTRATRRNIPEDGIRLNRKGSEGAVQRSELLEIFAACVGC
jgi:hypothetical protein